jgi:hypothetical protein
MAANALLGGVVKAAAIAIAGAILLAGCSLFGSDKPEANAGDTASSEEILKKNCADPKWKEQNLGLWYSVCRPPLKW